MIAEKLEILLRSETVSVIMSVNFQNCVLCFYDVVVFEKM